MAIGVTPFKYGCVSNPKTNSKVVTYIQESFYTFLKT